MLMIHTSGLYPDSGLHPDSSVDHCQDVVEYSQDRDHCQDGRKPSNDLQVLITHLYHHT